MRRVLGSGLGVGRSASRQAGALWPTPVARSAQAQKRTGSRRPASLRRTISVCAIAREILTPNRPNDLILCTRPTNQSTLFSNGAEFLDEPIVAVDSRREIRRQIPPIPLKPKNTELPMESVASPIAMAYLA